MDKRNEDIEILATTIDVAFGQIMQPATVEDPTEGMTQDLVDWLDSDDHTPNRPDGLETPRDAQVLAWILKNDLLDYADCWYVQITARPTGRR